ncbi:hypothetical protein [Candidatus Nitrosocosmicus hydrocola]|nr:hypothetical protein [Candidatus Nitrosocosmicus hydrocola]
MVQVSRCKRGWIGKITICGLDAHPPSYAAAVHCLAYPICVIKYS